jgi:predicted extracellular nuclease
LYHDDFLENMSDKSNLETFSPLNTILLTFLVLLSAATALAQRDRLIGDLQGESNVSPYVRETARVMGIVTARIKNGFFIQVADSAADKNQATSDGIFVFTNTEPDEGATVGHMVSVTGTVTEFMPRNGQPSLSVTEISMTKGRDFIQVLSKGNPLPKPVVLTPSDFLSGMIDQLERYEGMRVQVLEMTAVSPTGGRVIGTASSESNGVFFGVLTGTPRPFREPGLDLYDFLFLTDKEKDAMKKTYPKLGPFDSNPERIKVETAAQTGSLALDVSTFAELKNVTGVLHYGSRNYSILTDPDNKPPVAVVARIQPLPPPKPDQFLIAGMNLENFFDDVDDPANATDEVVPTEALEKRMKKISTAVRVYMQMPDVVGVVEAENLAVLKRLADKINADAVAGGKPDPKYEAHLLEGNDGRGIDNGFLVKSSRVKVVEVKQFGKDEKYKNPVKNEDAFLNDRPPLMLRFSLEDPKTKDQAGFTVIVNHLKSFVGYNDPKIQEDVRLKKKLQSEFLAKLVQQRQKADPAERIALVGDFNMYQFDDGITDLIGTIKGKPAGKDAVLISSEDLVESDLIDLVDLINIGQRYSYSFDGNAQVLDHVIINEQMKKHIAGFAYARLNADFPERDRGDANKVQRYSDHDPAVAYFSIADATKK